jgi:hypothetical protein
VTLGDRVFRKSLMKMIFRKLSKTASLPVTLACPHDNWPRRMFRNWQDAERIMREMAKAWIDEIPSFLVRAVAQVPPDSASRFCVGTAGAISFRLTRAQNLRFFRGW